MQPPAPEPRSDDPGAPDAPDAPSTPADVPAAGEPAPVAPAPVAPQEPAPAAPATTAATEPLAAEPARPEAAPPDDAVPEPAPAAPASPRRRRARRLVIAAAALLALVVLGPWLLSATVLTAFVRGALARGEQPGGLGEAELSWSRGLRLERLLIPSHREGVGPRVLLDRVAVEVPLARAALAAATGGTVPVRVVIGRGRIELDLPADADAGGEATPPPESPPEPEPEPEAGTEPEAGDMSLPCAVAAELVVEGLDIDVTLGAGTPTTDGAAAPPMRLAIRGLKVDGGAAGEATTAVAMPREFRASIDALRLEAPGLLDAPLLIEGGAFVIERLAVAAPTPGALPLERVSLVARLLAPRADAEGAPLRDLKLDLSLAQGELNLAVSLVTQGGTIALGTRTAPTDPRRIPLKIALDLDDIHVGGPTARALPYLLPLLHATTVSTRSGPVVGLPPVSIKGEGAFDLITGDDGAPLLEETLATLTGSGEFALASGSLAASRAVDGYARALTGLSVARYLDGLLPAALAFDGAAGRFEVAGGEVKLPAIDLRAPSLHLRLQGHASFDGKYRLNVRAVEAAAGPLAAEVLRVVDQAGGVTIEGDVASGTCAPALPDRSKLEAGFSGLLQRAPLPLPGLGRD